MTATQTDRAAQTRFFGEKVMGWQWCDRRAEGWGDGPQVWITGEDSDNPNSNPTFQGFEPFNDEKHCMMLVRAIPEEKRSEFGFNLLTLLIDAEPIDADTHPTEWMISTATPEQRCNAILRAYGYDPA